MIVKSNNYLSQIIINLINFKASELDIAVIQLN